MYTTILEIFIVTVIMLYFSYTILRMELKSYKFKCVKISPGVYITVKLTNYLHLLPIFLKKMPIALHECNFVKRVKCGRYSLTHFPFSKLCIPSIQLHSLLIFFLIWPHIAGMKNYGAFKKERKILCHHYLQLTHFYNTKKMYTLNNEWISFLCSLGTS